MKRISKKVTSAVLAVALFVGTPAISAQKAEAAELYSFCMLLKKGSSVIQEVSTGMDSYRNIQIKKNQVFYPTAQLTRFFSPDFGKVKSVSSKSSNSKIFKVVDKKKGKVKAVKPGTAKLTFKILWKHTAKSGKLEYPVYKKCTSKKDKSSYGDYKVLKKTRSVKKGKTYTFHVTLPYTVVGKK